MDNMDIFSYMQEQQAEKESPLAMRMRPTTIDEVVGQQHIIGKDKLLYRAIKADELFDLYHSLRAPYRKNAVWTVNDTTIAAIRKLKAQS